MKAWDADQPEPESVHPEVAGVSVRPGPGGADILESGPDGPPRSPRGRAAGLALVLVVVAATAGYLVGSRHRAPAAKPAASSAAAPAVVQPLAPTGKRCAAQPAGRLQLGVEIVNQSAAAVTLSRIGAVLPLQGLRATATTWGGCGQLRPADGAEDYSLPPGATTWLAVTFDVLVACPGPLPVSFTVDYTGDGQPGTADLPGFPDLGDVAYVSARCPARSS